MGNLECAFADQSSSEKAYASILPHELLARVGASGFAALSLANNHVNDAGNFETTYAELKQRFPGIQFFGTVEQPYAVFDCSTPSFNAEFAEGRRGFGRGSRRGRG